MDRYNLALGLIILAIAPLFYLNVWFGGVATLVLYGLIARTETSVAIRRKHTRLPRGVRINGTRFRNACVLSSWLLKAEAEHCRLLAAEFANRPEGPICVRLACAFDDLNDRSAVISAARAWS